MIPGLLLAPLIGALLGLLGGGGSILALPVFTFVLALDPKLAIAASFGVVGVGSLVAMLAHARRGNVDVRSALLFAVGSASVSFAAGAWLSQLLSGATQMVLFAIVMAVAAALMFRRKEEAIEPPPVRRSPAQLALLLLMGAGVGVLTGLAGVGGGFVIVPALVLLAGIPMRRAVGTSLLVIAINSFAAFAGYLTQPAIRTGLMSASIGSVGLPAYLAIFTLLVAAGAIGGSSLGRLIPARALRFSFATFLLFMAGYIIVRHVS